jgi:hypothetical protein
MDREHQDVELWPAAVELPGHLQAGEARHRDVEDGEVDVAGDARFECLGAIPGFRNHLQIWLGLQHELQATADKLMIVSEQDPRRQWYRHQ